MKRIAAFSLAVLCASGVAAADRSAEISLIPWPAAIEAPGGTFTLEPETKVVVAGDERVQAVAQSFGELLFRARGVRPEIVPGTADDAPKRAIVFTLEVGVTAPEAYRLEVTSKGVVASAGEPRGLFYAAVTLLQLATSDTTSAQSIRIPAVRITDTPRLRWRGLLLDSARQYQSVAFIKRYIDGMALHKLNVLHWHLADDQAWRLQIPERPKLTAAGSSYSPADVRDIVEYAAARNITIVPGLSMPGHASAAIAAYPELGAAEGAIDRSVTNLFNVEEATFAFLDQVFAQLAKIFPGEYVHIGAAEVPKDQWQQSQSVQIRMRELGIVNEQRLQRYFFERVTQSLSRHGRRLTGWDGILAGGISSNAVVMTARGLDGALGAAGAGYEVVVSSTAALSFDRPQNASESGGGPMVSLADVYKFDPAPTALSPQDRARLIGVQAVLSKAGAEGEDQLEALTWPRAAALGEIGWTPPQRSNWSDFLRRLVPQMTRYERLGMRYSDAAFRVQVVERGGTSQRTAIELAKQVPLGDIRYTLDGSEPTVKSPVYTDTFEVATPAVIKAAVFYENRLISRSVMLDLGHR